MSKLKTHSGAKKRFRKNKNGLIKAGKAFRRHLLAKKSQNRKRRLRGGLYIKSCDIGHLKPLLSYR